MFGRVGIWGGGGGLLGFWELWELGICEGMNLGIWKFGDVGYLGVWESGGLRV